MKYIKGYKTFESVITPSVINNDIEIKTFEDLVEFGRLNDFDVVDYEEFYDSLPEGDKKTAPPKVGMPFFALFHPIRKKPMFVLCIKNMVGMPHLKTIVSDIIGHERIHGEQNIRRGGLEFSLPNPSISKDYFSNKEEIMAFAWSIANELSREGKSLEESMIMLDKQKGMSTWIRLWSEIKRNCDDKIIKRYRKYIYLYLEEMI